MAKRVLVPLIFGFVGCAVLISLGVWQVRRLAWKEDLLAQIDARMAAAPVAVPGTPDADRDLYLPVMASGELTGETLVVLASLKRVGAIYRVISVLETGTRRVLVDRGYRKVGGHAGNNGSGPIAVTGNLHWPDEVDQYTPAPEEKDGTLLFFARDLPAMAERLSTEPVLIVARTVWPTDPDLTPLPVTSEIIPNDHLGYAITWFSLAITWAGMTVFLLWRMRTRDV